MSAATPAQRDFATRMLMRDPDKWITARCLAGMSCEHGDTTTDVQTGPIRLSPTEAANVLTALARDGKVRTRRTSGGLHQYRPARPKAPCDPADDTELVALVDQVVAHLEQHYADNRQQFETDRDAAARWFANGVLEAIGVDDMCGCPLCQS